MADPKPSAPADPARALRTQWLRRVDPAVVLIAGGLTLLALAWCATAIFQAARTVGYLTVENETAHPESAVVERTLALAQGRPLYDSPTEWPHNAAMYGPLSYAIPAALWNIAPTKGSLQQQAQRVFLFGRALSLAAGIAILAWLVWIARVCGLPWWAAAAAPVVFLSGELMLAHLVSFRPDFPMVALSLWAWAALCVRQRAWAIGAAVALMAGAFFFKQTALISAGALFVAWGLRRGWREAVVYGAALFAVLAAGVGALTAATGGRYFANSFGALSSPFRGRNALEIIADLGMLDWLVFALAAACAVAWWRVRPAYRPLTVGLLLTAAGNMLAMGRIGSAHNYLLEPWAWSCALTACLAAELWRAWRAAPRPLGRPVVALTAALATFVAIPAFLQVESVRLPNARSKRVIRDFAEQHPELHARLRAQPGPLLSVRGYPYWLSPAYDEAGQPATPPLDLFMVNVLEKTGVIGLDGLVARIEHRAFDYVILMWDVRRAKPTSWQRTALIPKAAIGPLREHYELELVSRNRAGYGEDLYLYVPKRRNGAID